MTLKIELKNPKTLIVNSDTDITHEHARTIMRAIIEHLKPIVPKNKVGRKEKIQNETLDAILNAIREGIFTLEGISAKSDVSVPTLRKYIRENQETAILMEEAKQKYKDTLPEKKRAYERAYMIEYKKKRKEAKGLS